MRLKKYILIIFLGIFSIAAYSQCNTENSILFSTDSTKLTIWNGQNYVPFFIKGINLGIAKPGTFPGVLTPELTTTTFR